LHFNPSSDMCCRAGFFLVKRFFVILFIISRSSPSLKMHGQWRFPGEF
jgi:hypothetical protein